jgi:Cu(I)/Ag(I) efflux system membrane protein CusA/SilA
VLRWPKATLAAAVLLLATTALAADALGGEFLPPLDEGDLLYMPTALPGLSAQKAGELLQQTDRMIKTVPEVERVFGKAGRAETATDPAPLEMFETTIQLKPRDQWRPGMTPEKLVEELDRAVKVPGLSNIWVPPIRNRIDMLATGIKSPIGVKVSGPTWPPSTAWRRRSSGGQGGAGRSRRRWPSADRRALCRRAHRPRGRGALRPEHRRRADPSWPARRRRERRRDGRRPGALSHQPALPARMARHAAAAACAALPHADGPADHAGQVAQVVVSDGPPMLKSENARPVGLGLRRRARARPGGRWRTTCSAPWRSRCSSSRA